MLFAVYDDLLALQADSSANEPKTKVLYQLIWRETGETKLD